MSLPKRHVSVLVPLLGLFCLTFASCGSVTIRKFEPKTPLTGESAEDAQERSYDEGVLFYAPWPYLLVSEGADGKRTATIVMLPDRTRPRILEWSPGLFGYTQAKASFTDGWNLTALDSKVNSGLSGAITAIAGAASGGPEASSLVEPGFHKLYWWNDEWHTVDDSNPSE